MRVLAVTGTRADWGLLAPVLRALRDDPWFDLVVLATGQHLMAGSPSLDEIRAAGFDPAHLVDMGLGSDDGPAALAAAMGRAVAGVGAALQTSRPDLMLVLGDRYEILAAASAALLARVPIAHIAGGDVTEGAFDDSIRHAITKLASLHFVTNAEARRRVIQLGEAPDRVVLTGSPGIDEILAQPLLGRDAFFASVGLAARRPTFLVTFHPPTLAADPARECAELLAALEAFPDAGVIFTGSNADPRAREIDRLIQEHVARHAETVFHASLGSRRYLSALSHVDVVIGNSSSGLYEAPSFPVPIVNIGDRQARRPRAASVIDCAADRVAVAAAIGRALSEPTPETDNPYGDGHATDRIVAVLKSLKDPADLVRKSFEDLPV